MIHSFTYHLTCTPNLTIDYDVIMEITPSQRECDDCPGSDAEIDSLKVLRYGHDCTEILPDCVMEDIWDKAEKELESRNP